MKRIIDLLGALLLVVPMFGENILAIYQKDGQQYSFGFDDKQESPAVSYEYVDLGLSVKWATCNVGATKPEKYGDFYAWGETEPKTDYSWSTYKWCKGSNLTLTKYCYNSNNGYNGFIDTLTVLAPEDDVAHVKWGGSWRMPTKAEKDELLRNCTWTWTTLNGVNGVKVTSNVEGYTDRSIFFPAAGFISVRIMLGGDSGLFWTSSLCTNGPRAAWYFGFSEGSSRFTGNYDRNIGLSVRPVCP